jgi:RNA polymerase sigma-70 factor, ECF subfamily
MHPTSLSLLVRLQQEDAAPEAWARFTQLYAPLLFHWAKRLGLAASDAEDFVQDLLLHLLDKLDRFEHRGAGSFRGWLRQVATNKARERCRKRAAPAASGGTDHLRSFADDSADDPFWEVDYRRHLVARALEIMQAEFAPATWQACWQRVLEDRPAAEVAANLGLSEAAVYVYTGRVLRRLREELSGLLD